MIYTDTPGGDLDRKTMKIRTAIITLLLCAAFAACDSRADEPDLEEQQVIFLAATLPGEETSTNNCVPQQESAIRCAASASVDQASYVAIVESAYSVTVPAAEGGGTGGATEICEVYPDSSVWTSGDTYYTAAGKNCHYTCELEYWDDQIEAGNCTAANYSNLTTELSGCPPFVWKTTCNVSQMQNCLNACLTQGTLLPN